MKPKRIASIILPAALVLASCGLADDAKDEAQMTEAESPRDPDTTQRESIKLLDEIKASIETLSPGLSWLPQQKTDSNKNCPLSNSDQRGTYFLSGLRHTPKFPTSTEWDSWFGSVRESAARYGYTAPDDLPLHDGDHSILLTTPEGDELYVMSFSTGGFSFYLQTVCAPYPEGDAATK